MNAEPSDQIMMLVVCDRMKWTFQEYMQQPEAFIKSLILKWSLDAEHKLRSANQQQ